MLSPFRFFLIANLAQFASRVDGADVYLSWPEDCGEDALENALLGEYMSDSMIEKEETIIDSFFDSIENKSVVVGDEDGSALHGRTDDEHRSLGRCDKRSKCRYWRKRRSWGRSLLLQLAENEAESEASFQEDEVHTIVENMLAKCIEMSDRKCECALKNYWITFD